jgi:hypothetical protein
VAMVKRLVLSPLPAAEPPAGRRDFVATPVAELVVAILELVVEDVVVGAAVANPSNEARDRMDFKCILEACSKKTKRV